MTRAQIAQNNFLNGQTCAQAVLLAFADLFEADAATLAALSRPFGAGMGRLREVCGTVSGAAMALGLLYPELPKSALYALVQEHAAAFREREGSYLCRDLLRGAGVEASTSPVAEARTREYYRKRPCPELCAVSAELLEGLLLRHGFFGPDGQGGGTGSAV